MTRTIDLRTAIPGPRSKDILARKERVVADPLAVYLPIVAWEGHGAALTDVDGNTFIDFIGGVGCLNVGHSHPRVVEAAQEQLSRFAHTDFTVIAYEPYVALAERLTALAPFHGPTKAAFFNAGTEAVENVKLARLYMTAPGDRLRGRLPRADAALDDAYLEPHPYKAGMGPYAPEVYRAPFAQDIGARTRDGARPAAAHVHDQVAAEDVAAIVVEPVQGEGGFLPAPQAFLRGLRELCDEHGIVLVVDEVQTGFGRTGKLFATEHYGIEPDLMTVAKSIAAGLPLSGVIGKAHIMDAGHEGAVGGTFVGNPVALAAALAVLDVIEEEGLVERAAAIGEVMRARMLGWQERFAAIGDVRGLGAMLAIEFVSDRTTKAPAGDVASAVIEEAAQRGLLCEPAFTQLHPGSLPARHHRRRAGRGAHGLGGVLAAVLA